MANEPIKTKNEIVEEAINKLMLDDEKIKEILTANSSEEMKESFKSVGLELTDEQIEVFKKNFIDGMNREINKLPAEEREKLIKKASEAELEKISGGALENTQIGIGSGLGIGGCAGAFLGFFLVSLVTLASDYETEEGGKAEPDDKLKDAGKNAVLTTLAAAVAGAALGGIGGAGADLIVRAKPQGDLPTLGLKWGPKKPPTNLLD